MTTDFILGEKKICVVQGNVKDRAKGSYNIGYLAVN